jgi:soluble P-type ATPase
MIELNIPGAEPLQIQHMVMDYNGTLAIDGQLLEGVASQLNRLAALVQLHIITADTFGLAGRQLAGLPCQLSVLPAGQQARAKQDYVRELGAQHCVAIGNGRNDRLMLREAAIGIVLLQAEGAAVPSVEAADIVCRDILDALALFVEPRRLIATLRD